MFNSIKCVLVTVFLVIFALPTLGATKQHTHSGGPFEGNWESCFSWQGDKICGGKVLLQNQKNVCGTWTYFATNRMYSGNIQLTTLRSKTAKKDFICGDIGSDTHTECEADVDANLHWEVAKGYMMICDGSLEESDKLSVIKCSKDLHKKKISNEAIKEMLSERWIQQCLTRP